MVASATTIEPAKPQLAKLPALVVIKGTEGKVLDYPANEAAALALLKQYGGE